MAWIVLLVLTLLALGVASAISQFPPPAVARSLIGGLMIVAAGFIAFSARREPAFDSAARKRQFTAAAGMCLFGAASLIPQSGLSLAVKTTALAVMVAAIIMQRRARLSRAS